MGIKRKNFWFLGLILVGFIFFGCTTKYQPMGFSGGYKDFCVKDNVYFVEIKCNAFTPQSTAVQYLHRRAMEVCKENGYCDYKMKDERDSTGYAYTGSYGSGMVSASQMQYPGRNAYVECIKCD